MPTAQLRELADSANVVGLNVDQYLRMIEQGILPEGEPIELLDGILVRKDRSKAGEDPMTVGFDHVWAVENLRDVLSEVRQHGFHVRCQQPVALPPDGVPEPDGSIARGTLNDYAQRWATAADVPCVIEVADSSLQHDRVTKLRIYAQGGITQYVIVNLVDRLIEIYEQPDRVRGLYQKDAQRRGGETVEFSLGTASIVLEARMLLPPT
jgi:Uma2 family endonuclease